MSSSVVISERLILIVLSRYALGSLIASRVDDVWGLLDAQALPDET